MLTYYVAMCSSETLRGYGMDGTLVKAHSCHSGVPMFNKGAATVAGCTSPAAGISAVAGSCSLNPAPTASAASTASAAGAELAVKTE